MTNIKALKTAILAALRLLAVGAIAAFATGPLLAAPAGGLQAPTRPRADQAAAVIAALRDSADQGFAPGAFPSATRAAGADGPEVAAIAYARAQHGGRLPIAAFPRHWAIRPAPYDAAADFAEAVRTDRVAAWLAGLAPPDERYARLARAYRSYQAIAARGGWAAQPRTARLGLGDTGVAVEALGARLAIEDPALATPPPHPGAPAVFDAALVAAVMRAQVRYGLTPDGRVGRATIEALNVPVEARLLQIRANLERWRWAPRALPAFRVELNTADASLELFDGAAPSLAMRAIVGRAAKPTPMFQDRISEVVFNPPWNVPAEIATKEIWPKIRRDPGYMAREHFIVRPGGGLMQLPGPKCALGAIKFELSNAFGVYLHDTPARGLFALDRRALSHGCMRLADPMDLARRLLAGDTDWPDTTINLTLLGGETTRAPLKSPVPVYIFYWTAFVNGQDQIQFRSDVYGWDRTLAILLSRQGQVL